MDALDTAEVEGGGGEGLADVVRGAFFDLAQAGEAGSEVEADVDGAAFGCGGTCGGGGEARGVGHVDGAHLAEGGPGVLAVVFPSTGFAGEVAVVACWVFCFLKWLAVDRLAVMNVPNSITLARLVLTLAYVVAASVDGGGAAMWALGFFCVAAATDWLDGYFARKLGQVTALGKLLDPLVDKILTGAGFLHMAAVGLCPVWVAAVILAREYFVTGLRQVAIERGEVLAADVFGKWKTTFQMFFLIAGLLHVVVAQGSAGGDAGVCSLCGQLVWLLPVLLWTAFALTLVSGLNYLWAGRGLLVGRDDA